MPLTHTGGWVVGENPNLADENLGFGDVAWNMHIGAKLNSVFATISPDGLTRVKRSLERLIGILKTADDSVHDAELRRFKPKLDKQTSPISTTFQENLADVESDNSVEIPIRWRLDFLAKKFSVLFPSTHDISEIDTSHPHLARSNALLSFSLHSWLQAAPRTTESVFIRSSFSDVSLVRTSDDWPLLESSAITADITLSERKLVNACCQLRLSMPDTFSWNGNRSSSVGGRAGGFDTDVLNHAVLVSISISPLRFNIAAQTGSLLLAVFASLKKFSEKDEKKDPINDRRKGQLTEATPKTQESGCFVKVWTESFEVKLLRESERSTSISFADPLASLVALRVVGSASQDVSKDEASIEIGDLCLYDLSSLPGARVFGINHDEEQTRVVDSGTDNNGDFEARSQIMLFHVARSREEISSGNLDVYLGQIQCLVLPSLLRSLLSFEGDMKAFAIHRDVSLKDKNETAQQPDKEMAVPFGLKQIDFALRVAGFECLLPSRDLFSYIRNRSKEPVNVVAFRWKSFLTGKVATLSPVSPFDISLPDSLALPLRKCQAGSVTAQASLSVEDFQVLRTNVRRRPFPRSAAGGPHISPCSFVVHPPSVGEQRITNPFWFKVSYQLAAVAGCSSMPAEVESLHGQGYGAMYHVSQAFRVDAGLVDVLVYIKQSTGGMNDALRVTIRPILDLLKRKDEPEVNQKNEVHNSIESSMLSQSFKSATNVCSLQCEGIQITCVPGGATRLTESPIVKCELSRMKVGLVGIALPMDPKVAIGSTSHISAMERLRQAGLERFGVVEPTISGGLVAHMTLGGWMQAEMSARYHNRRLVAWEPFIEPWVVNVRTGIDMVRAFKLSPSAWLGELNSRSSGFMSSIVGEGINEKAGERIRDIGRLLRSPFSPTASVRKSGDGQMVGHEEMSPTNLSYIVMKSISPRVVASALYPAGSVPNNYSPRNVQVQMSGMQCLPGTEPTKWLEVFGYPSVASHGKSDSAAVVCSISDSRPLNVNLTGALIENVMGYLGGGNKESIHPPAPHMIRNFTGLVSVPVLNSFALSYI